MTFGTLIAEGRKRQSLTQQDVANGVPCSRESISKYETNERPIPKDMFTPLLNSIDDPESYLQGWREASGYVSIPFFNGDYIDQHPSSMKHLVQIETNEALEKLEKACWYKPIHTKTDIDREEMKHVVKELLDSAASMINLVTVICREYDFSMKDIFRAWHVSLKARHFKK